jgi:hypothetical protein
MTTLVVLLAHPLRAQWVAAAYLGAAHSAHDKLLISKNDNDVAILENVRFESRSFRGPLYYGLRVGHFSAPTSTWGLEAELVHLKVFALLTPQHDSSEFAMSHGLNLALFNIVLRTAPVRPAGALRRLTLSGRLGAGPTIPHVEARLLGERENGYQFGRACVAGAGGVELQMTERVAALAEYKLTYTRQRVGVGGDLDVRTRVLTQHVVFGLRWRL